MGNRKATTTSSDPRGWKLVLFLAWLNGLFIFQVPFQTHFRIGNGAFGWNILISVVLLVAGVITVTGLAHLFRALVRGTRQEFELRDRSLVLHGIAAALLAASSLPALLFGLGSAFHFYWPAVVALVVWLVVASASITASTRVSDAPTLRQRLRAPGHPRRWRFNGAFWLLVFLILLGVDLFNLGSIESRSTGITAILVLGRLLTLAAFTVGVMLLVQLLLKLFPPFTRWIVIAATATIPLVFLADFGAGQYWNQTLIDVLNTFTLTGEFDMKQQLEAGGVKQGPLTVFLLLGAAIAAMAGVYLLLQRVSNRSPLSRTRTRRAVATFGILWFASFGQQVLSMAALPKRHWQAEHTTFKIHLSPLKPDPGLETIPVRFAESQSDEQSEVLLAGPLPTLARRPDIYIVMIETWRGDSITPEITPFLHKFRREECQQFASTYAGSNCTPVSWFTMFHSRLGIHWKEAVAEMDTPGGLKGAYPLRLLHKLGYRYSVRAVCDLGYQEMADLNYGKGHKLAEAFLDNPMLPRGLEIPEREIIVVDDLRKQLLETPRGGRLHFLSLDSPHYNYYWPEQDFAPIHRDCANNINYASLNPSEEDIREVVKRYENSVHWIDEQLRQFVDFLKAHDRYDNSIIIFTGDHGEEFQEHGSWFHCSNLTRVQTEVPIIIKWPSWIENQPSQDLVTHMDIMPSVLDALGLDPKYFEDLAGHSTLREHPGEALLSTLWAGMSGVGVCFIKDGMKANFAASGLWTGNVPETLYLIGYTDLDDRRLDPEEVRGARDLPHSAFLRKRYRATIERFFSRFGGE